MGVLVLVSSTRAGVGVGVGRVDSEFGAPVVVVAVVGSVGLSIFLKF